MPKTLNLPDPDPNGDSEGWQVILSNDGVYRLDVTLCGEVATFRSEDLTSEQLADLRKSVALLISLAKTRLGYE